MRGFHDKSAHSPISGSDLRLRYHQGMVLGLGIDMVEVERIRESVARFGDRFLHRIFTESERRYCAAKHAPEQSLAARFAAKEAAAKALGTGISRGVAWQSLEVVRAAGGTPSLVLHGEARELAARLGVGRSSLSLTHTEAQATAIVIFEGEGT